MENKRIFQDGQSYFYLYTPKGYDIYNMTIKGAIYETSIHTASKTLSGLWCFEASERPFYKDLMLTFQEFLKKEFQKNKFDNEKYQGEDFHIRVPVKGDKILQMEVVEKQFSKRYDYNHFSDPDVAEDFLQKIKAFFAANGVVI